MSDLALYDPAVELERAADPGEFVVLCLERGKTWLTEALAHGDLDAIMNAKGWAETLRVATVQKQLGLDAEVAASELVRRAERALGLGIRAGQEAGEVRRRGGREPLLDTKNFFRHGTDSVQTYAVTDGVSDDQFDQAIDSAKAEKNLSRANVVRKVEAVKRDAPVAEPTEQPNPRSTPTQEKVAKAREMAAAGYSSRQIADALGYVKWGGLTEFLRRHQIDVPADAVVKGTRRIDSGRVVSETVSMIEGVFYGLGLVDFDALNRDEIAGWAASLSDSIRKLSSFTRQLKEAAQ